MKSIDVDEEVFENLGRLAKPFVETTPNQVLRRLLRLDDKMPTKSSKKKSIKKVKKNKIKTQKDIQELRLSSSHVHPAFLTFLIDKRLNAQGNFKTPDVLKFMANYNLKIGSDIYRNPWMKSAYKGANSCTRTIEHFRQTRKYSCWFGRDEKHGCNKQHQCIYHPSNPHKIKNKCDLSKGIIWKRLNKTAPFSYGEHYLEVVEKDILQRKGILLKPLLAVLYPDYRFEKSTIEFFMREFNFVNREMNIFLFN